MRSHRQPKLNMRVLRLRNFQKGNHNKDLYGNSGNKYSHEFSNTLYLVYLCLLASCVVIIPIRCDLRDFLLSRNLLLRVRVVQVLELSGFLLQFRCWFQCGSLNQSCPNAKYKRNLYWMMFLCLFLWLFPDPQRFKRFRDKRKSLKSQRIGIITTQEARRHK